MTYTMKEVCEQVGISYDTLKFYCNEGLIPNVQRDHNNHRIFTEQNLGWIKSLICLKKCGMSLAEMKTYLELCLQGEKSIPERQIMLDQKLHDLRHRMQELQESIDFIHWKQNFYNDILNGKQDYFSNLIVEE